MLVTMNEVLKYAEEHNCAVGSFNTPTLENLWAVIDAAEKKECTSNNYACRTS